MYTSGTTGVPKGVLSTHRNLAAAAVTSARWGFDDTAISLTPLPLFHIGGIGWVYCGLWHATTTILVSEFDPVAVLDLLERRRVTNPIFVPTMLQMMTAAPGASDRDFSALRTIVYGASPITTTALRAAISTFRCGLLGLYGLTESTGGVIRLDPEDHDPDGPRQHLLRSAGRPYEWVELQIADPASGERLAAGQVGEVWLRGPNVMAGYYGRPEETAAALTPEGWLRTGDGGYLDEDGYLFLTDRVKDMIVSGGENVYPIEVEEVAGATPGRRGCHRHRRPRRALGRIGDARSSSGEPARRWRRLSCSRSRGSDSRPTSSHGRSTSSRTSRAGRPARSSSGSCAAGTRTAPRRVRPGGRARPPEPLSRRAGPVGPARSSRRAARTQPARLVSGRW